MAVMRWLKKRCLVLSKAERAADLACRFSVPDPPSPPVAQLAELVEEERASERVAGFSLVETSLGAPAQVEIAQPVEHEDRAFDPPDLAQGQRQPVLAWVSGQSAQHRRCGGGAAADRGGEAQ